MSFVWRRSIFGTSGIRYLWSEERVQSRQLPDTHLLQPLFHLQSSKDAFYAIIREKTLCPPVKPKCLNGLTSQLDWRIRSTIKPEALP